MNGRPKRHGITLFPALVAILLLPGRLGAESFRVQVVSAVSVSLDGGGVTVPLSYNSAVLLSLGEGVRFLRGIELEFTVPQTFLPWRGSLALAIYRDLGRVPAPGVADVEARQYSIEPVPNKIQSVYQIPLVPRHGLRTSPYAQVHSEVIPPSSFPILFRVLPVAKGLGEDIETMRFSLTVRPIPGDEGAVLIIPRYPENLPNRPFTVLVDDEVLENPLEERVLREGEHRLSVVSADYRDENRVFIVERGKVLPLIVDLQDPTPLVIFEAPENALVFFDGRPAEASAPIPVEPGTHEVRFQLDEYTIVRPLAVRRGKTYRMTLVVDVVLEESD